MIYIDTSVWIAQHTREVGTKAVQHWMAEQDIEAFVCSQWVKTEYASGLSIKFRRGGLSVEHFTSAHQCFAELCVAGPSWISLRDEDFLQAARLCSDSASALRAGDALHLAVALRSGCSAFCSLDHVLNKNAAACGLHTFAL